jgi:hypothetical protein
MKKNEIKSRLSKGAAIGTVSTEMLLMLFIGGGIISWRRKMVLEQ